MWELYRLIEAMKDKQKEAYEDIRNTSKRSLSYNTGRLVVLDELIDMAQVEYTALVAKEAKQGVEGGK